MGFWILGRDATMVGLEQIMRNPNLNRTRAPIRILEHTLQPYRVLFWFPKPAPVGFQIDPSRSVYDSIRKFMIFFISIKFNYIHQKNLPDIITYVHFLILMKREHYKS